MSKYGDGLVTLLMFAFGLGCLRLVFLGLMNGAVDGAGSATFPFASKPVKFILIELFWLGFGLMLLLGAWRGLSRPHLGEGDEAEDEEGIEDTQPVPLRQGQKIRPLSHQSLALPGPSAPLAVAPQRPSAAAAGPKALAPPPLALYASRFYAAFVFAVLTVWMLGAVYTALALSTVFGKPLMSLIAAPPMLAYLIVMGQCVRNFFHAGPVLVFDAFGITNYRKGGHLIPWTEIDAARLDAEYSATHLVLRFRDARDVRKHFGAWRGLRAITGHFFYQGFEGRVKLSSLTFKRSTVLNTARAFIRHARR